MSEYVPAVSLEARMAFFGGTVPARTVVRMPTAWFGMEMAGLSGPQTRLRAWAAAGCPDVPAQDTTVIGDAALAVDVHRALSQLPAPVRAFTAASVLFLTAGRTIAGFQVLAPHYAPSAYGVPQIIFITPTQQATAHELDALIAHEVAHAWLAPCLTAMPARKVVIDGIVTPPSQQEPGGPQHAMYVLEEYISCRLAKLWGFHGRSADPSRYDDELRRLRQQHGTTRPQPPPPVGGGIGSSAGLLYCGGAAPQRIGRFHAPLGPPTTGACK